ncbi:uncharacterized protein LOC108670793 [Hyalella azteca]|uniref:Uncharacterized protein LOC108670793 n=1 Tax=Hyalella azteca TaxID=294128 RepID=A0A8B7NJE7_HYAAZ|nr:uncharacterized protein LOC108670793 [Hyalella azteca]
MRQVIKLLLFSCVASVICQDAGLWAEVYMEVGGEGQSLYTRDYLSDFTSLVPGASSICGAGVWLLYEKPKYDGSGTGQSHVFLGSGDCQDIPFNATSIRQAGSPSVFDRPSLTLYAYTHFRSLELYITEDLPFLGVFSDQAYSAVVTGSLPWTVYTYDSYGGQGTCLSPNETVEVGGATVGVGLFPTYYELGSSGLIRSVRRGCDF